VGSDCGGRACGFVWWCVETNLGQVRLDQMHRLEHLLVDPKQCHHGLFQEVAIAELVPDPCLLFSTSLECHFELIDRIGLRLNTMGVCIGSLDCKLYVEETCSKGRWDTGKEHCSCSQEAAAKTAKVSEDREDRPRPRRHSGPRRCRTTDHRVVHTNRRPRHHLATSFHE
jgi:hypothetical protein